MALATLLMSNFHTELDMRMFRRIIEWDKIFSSFVYFLIFKKSSVDFIYYLQMAGRGKPTRLRAILPMFWKIV
jgi:hypothetical protein